MIEEVLGAIELAQEVGNTVADLTAEPKDLKDKYRSMQITVINRTQFELVYLSSHMAHGRFWTAPSNAAQFDSTTFSACNMDGSIITGLQGACIFQLRMPTNKGYESLDIGVGFDDPAIGSRAALVEFESSARKVDNSNKMLENGHSIISKDFTGTDKNGKEVTLRFVVSCTPASNMKVTITQEVVA